MADSIDRVFAHALQTVRKIPRSGSARPPAADRLKLYGLYKQSMEGDVEGVMERPGGYADEAELTREEKAEVEKWDAWASAAGLSRTAAKSRYIDTLISTMHTYAYGTPEARELVDELEFVWDQVKNNTGSIIASNTDNGNGRTTGIDEILEAGTREGRTKEGLRVLRPMSDQDEEEERAVAAADGDNANDGPEPRSRRGAIWQTRVDRALVQMTAEIAALREVVEARGRSLWVGGSRPGWFAWLLRSAWALLKRAVVDATIIFAIWLIVRWKKGGKELVLKLWKRTRREMTERAKNGMRELKGG